MTEQIWDTNRIWTVPNVLSFLRLLAIPVFTWLIIVGQDWPAAIILMVSAVTDWFDGYLARALRQQTKLGAQLDPVTDRLYILMTIIALLIRELIPWWFFLALILRDAMLLGLVPFLLKTGRNALPVNFVGKCGTFALLIALPLVLVSSPAVLGWTWLCWMSRIIAGIGTVLYWAAGFLYVRQTIWLVRNENEQRI